MAHAAGAETLGKTGSGKQGAAARARRIPVLLLHRIKVFGLREDEARLGGADKRQAVASLLHEEDPHGGKASAVAALRRQGVGHHRQVRRHRQAGAHLRQPRHERGLGACNGCGKDWEEGHLPCRKTYHFFLLVENEKLTKIVSLIGNDLETSGLLYSAMFCTNQKNAFLTCKGNIFI